MAPSLPGLCFDGKIKKLRASLARGEDVNQRDAGGYTGLMRAVVMAHEAVVELLLQQPGLDVNLADEENHQTAPHGACQEAHAGIVRRLLAHPTLTCHNAMDSEGYSPLMWAVVWRGTVWSV